MDRYNLLLENLCTDHEVLRTAVSLFSFCFMSSGQLSVGPDLPYVGNGLLMYGGV